MKSSIICLLLLTSHMLFAQELKWHEGALVMKNGAVSPGEISLTPGQNLVLFRSNRDQSRQPPTGSESQHNADVIPAHRLRSVFFYDEDANINRRYVALGNDGVFSGIELFEVVLQGRIDVLRQSKNMHQGAGAKDFNYYCSEGSRVIPLRKFHSEIFNNIDPAFRKRLTAFVKANGLERASDANVITIIGFYNKSVRDEQTLARY